MSEPRVAVVTGTSSGIGMHTAVGLACAGVQVVATMRDVTKAGRLRAAAEAAGVEVDVQALDVTDETAAGQCVRKVLADHGSLDVLVNNAGRGSIATLEQMTLDDLRDQLEVNYLGVASLTRLVLPSMREAGRGRIVTVTSVGGAVGQPFADSYCAAKFAVEGLMQSLAPVVATFGIEVSVVEPGPVSTEFAANASGVKAGVDPTDPYRQLRAAYAVRSEQASARAQSAADAAVVVVEAAITTAPKFRWQTSRFATALVGLSLGDTDGSRVLGQTSTWLS